MNSLPYSVELQLYQIRQKFLISAHDSNDGLLAQIIAENELGISESYHFLEAVVFTGVFTKDFSSVKKTLPLFFPNLRKLNFTEHNDDPAGAQVIKWEVSAGNFQSFCFCSKLFSLDENSKYTIIARWLAFLHIANRCGVAFNIRGRTYIDVGDWSSGLGLSFSDNRESAALVPDSSFLASNSYQSTRMELEEDNIIWDQKLPKAIWRGSSTGSGSCDIMEVPRVQLCMLGLKYPEKLDAGITSIVQLSTPDQEATLRSAGVCKPYLPIRQCAKFKYQIDIDGNTNSWPGLFQKLLTGSVVLKIISQANYRQWYYPRLIPWVNYVPIQSDFSDLFSIIEYLIQNDETAKTIAIEGKKLATEMSLEKEVLAATPTVKGALIRGHYLQSQLG